MSTIVLSCPGCGKRYELSGSLAGKKARCKACSQEFAIPVPRQVAPPSTSTAPVRPKTSAPARSAPPPPVLDSFNPYDDVDDHSAGQASVSYDDDETYLPPRAGMVRTSGGGGTKPKKRRRPGSSSSVEGLWALVPIGGVGLTVLLTIVAIMSKPFALMALGFIVIAGFLLYAAGRIWGLVNACRESASCGIMYLFVPFYSLYYYATNWEEMKGPFCTCFVSGVMVIVMPFVFVLSGLGKEAFQAQAQARANQRLLQNRMGNMNPPHVGFQANRPANQNNLVLPPVVMQPNQPVGMPNNMPGMPPNNGMPGVPRMPPNDGMPGMPPGVPQPPNFGPNGPSRMNNFPGRPGGMNNFPGRPSNMPGPFGPGGRFGRQRGLPGQ